MGKDDTQKIVLSCILSGFRSTVDGGIRLTLDLDESQLEGILELNALKNEALTVVVMRTEDVLSK